MKFLHTADWHIGRKLNGFSLLEEQKAAFQQVIKIATEEQVDAIIIAGDLYDRSVPSVDSVALFNEMMLEMNLKASFPVLAISGNHDSATRLDTGSPWLKAQQFHLNTQLEQAFEAIEMDNTQFFLLPYIEPFHARDYFEDDSIKDIQSAMKMIIEVIKTKFDKNKKHVLVGHFFAAGSLRSESETPVEVGGLDSVPLDLLEDFDYVALGHLHDKNAIKKTDKIQYSGALLKYSLSEEKQEKGVRIVEIKESEFSNHFIPITPLRDVKKLEASYKELTSPDFYELVNREDYLAISLTDKTIIFNALHELRKIYPFIISLERSDKELKQIVMDNKNEELAKLKPEVLIADYFKEVVGKELTSNQSDWLEEAIIESRKER